MDDVINSQLEALSRISDILIAFQTEVLKPLYEAQELCKAVFKPTQELIEYLIKIQEEWNRSLAELLILSKKRSITQIPKRSAKDEEFPSDKIDLIRDSMPNAPPHRYVEVKNCESVTINNYFYNGDSYTINEPEPEKFWTFDRIRDTLGFVIELSTFIFFILQLMGKL